MAFLASSICVKRELSWDHLKQSRLEHINFTDKNVLENISNEEGFLFICFLPSQRSFQ